MLTISEILYMTTTLLCQRSKLKVYAFLCLSIFIVIFVRHSKNPHISIDNLNTQGRNAIGVETETPSPSPLVIKKWLVNIGSSDSCEKLLIDYYDYNILFVFTKLPKYAHSQCHQFDVSSPVHSSFESSFKSLPRDKRLILSALHYVIKIKGALLIQLLVADGSKPNQPNDLSKPHPLYRELPDDLDDGVGLHATPPYVYLSRDNRDFSSHFCDVGSKVNSELMLCSEVKISMEVNCLCKRQPCHQNVPSLVYNPASDHPVNFDLLSATYYPSSFYLLCLAVLGNATIMPSQVVPLLRLHSQYARVPGCHVGLASSAATTTADQPSKPTKELPKSETDEAMALAYKKQVAKTGNGIVTEALFAWYLVHRPPLAINQRLANIPSSCTRTTYSRSDNRASIVRLYADTCSSITMKPQRRSRVDFASSFADLERCHDNGVDRRNRRPANLDNDPLVLVVFNEQSHVAISLPYYETLYRPLYNNILYCVPDHLDNELLSQWKISYIVYGDYDNEHTSKAHHVAGAFSYNCSIIAMSLGYKVKGYLTVADDLVFMPRTLAKFSADKAWFTKVKVGNLNNGRECKLGMCDFITRWPWWGWNLMGTLRALQELQVSHGDAYTSFTSVYGGPAHALGAFSDIFYVPAGSGGGVATARRGAWSNVGGGGGGGATAAAFSRLLRVFLRHRVFVEIAVATSARLLPVATVTSQLIDGAELWLPADRASPWQRYQPRLHPYLHPVKLSSVALDNKGFRKFYCDDILTFLHDPHSRTVN